MIDKELNTEEIFLFIRLVFNSINSFELINQFNKKKRKKCCPRV